MKKTRLFGLLVGINDYPHVSKLRGCLNDLATMEAYLQNRPDLDTHLLSLRDAAATKAAIVEQIRTHLGQASKGDTILLYIAGHGVQEETEVPAFVKAEAGGKLESFVCYDSKPMHMAKGENTCLADKEIRFLIHQLSANGAHIVLIFDCCHSGSISRHGPDSLGPRQAGDQAVPPRPWQGFIFHEEIPEEAGHTQTLQEILPPGAHVQLSACRDSEVAWEHKEKDGTPRGLFSLSLLKFITLTGGSISYYQLMRRLQNFMRGWKQKRQTPQLFVHSDDPHAIHGGLLGAEVEMPAVESFLQYNPSVGWILPLGAIHGLEEEDKLQAVRLYDSETDRLGAVIPITMILPGHCVMKLPDDREWDRSQPILVSVKAAIKEPFGLYLNGSDTACAALKKQLTDKMSKMRTQTFRFCLEENLADYTLHLGSSYQLSLAGDDKPLLAAIHADDSAAPDLLFQWLNHISSWNRLLLAHPKKSRLMRAGSDFPVQLNMFRDTEEGEKQALVIKGNVLKLDLTRGIGPQDYFEDLSFQLINRTKEPLYVSLIYMSMGFEANINLLPSGGVWLDPGEEIWAIEGHAVRVDLEPHLYQDNWPGATEYLKLIVSTEQFDPEPLTLEELDLPGREIKSTRGMHFPQSTKPEAAWAARTIEVFERNPNFDPDP